MLKISENNGTEEIGLVTPTLDHMGHMPNVVADPQHPLTDWLRRKTASMLQPRLHIVRDGIWTMPFWSESGADTRSGGNLFHRILLWMDMLQIQNLIRIHFWLNWF